MEQTIFDMLYPKFKIEKPIRLIEFFAGYGSQALALKYLGVEFEHWKICEWAVKSIQAYKDIHFTNESAILVGLNKEQEIERLYKQGISSNYNEPMTKEQINRLSLEQIYRITENNLLTHNLVNIQQVKGKDLEIVNTDKYDYILTYSFPCQDLSLAGKGKGMSDTSTRSGMLWEVERILTECYELGSMPQILLMENVPQVHSQDNIRDFHKWQLRLEELGYKNYMQDLIATDYGIPQTRNRCFMVSILGDYSYTFPKPIPLKLKLKDLLEDNVDEKYFISDAMYNYLQSESSGGFSRKESFERIQEKFEKEGMAATLTTQNNLGVCVIGGIGEKKSNGGTQWYQQDRIYDNNIGLSLSTTAQPYYPDNQLRIRKLTPRECFRLMGVKDEDFNKVRVNQSDSSLYHLAGDSIVVNVLMAIFNELLKKEGE